MRRNQICWYGGRFSGLTPFAPTRSETRTGLAGEPALQLDRHFPSSCAGTCSGGLISGAGTTGISNWWSAPIRRRGRRQLKLRIGWPCWIATTRLTEKPAVARTGRRCRRSAPDVAGAQEVGAGMHVADGMTVSCGGYARPRTGRRIRCAPMSWLWPRTGPLRGAQAAADR